MKISIKELADKYELDINDLYIEIDNGKMYVVDSRGNVWLS